MHTKNRKVNALVRVDGKKVSFVAMHIEQQYGQHHTFHLKLDFEILGKGFMRNPSEQMELIGKQVVIDIQHGDDNGAAYVFKGVITNMRMFSEKGKKEYLLLDGYSPTIMLERGKRMDIYSDTTLRNIFKKLTEGVKNEYMPHLNAPTYKNKIDFLMQYNETDWQFLQRIAYIYGENLFFSGSELLFGEYEEWEPVKLTYDVDITSLEFCSQLLPNNSVAYQYMPAQDTIIEKRSPERIEGATSYVEKADALNLVLTQGKPAKTYMNAHLDNGAEMTEMSVREKSRNAAQTVYVKGEANTYRCTIGRLITVKMPEKYTNTRSLGTYRVTKSVHIFDEGGFYHNVFEAVPSSLKTMPVAKPNIPLAQSVIGKVSSTDDPQGQGRVQVDFSFANQQSKVWMRVMTPNAGSSNDVSKNRGFVFIPEVDDQVMINFEFGDPNRPYVAGSMFHGNNGAGGNTNNAIKSITTRSGSTLTFTDIEDKKKYGIVFQHNGQNGFTLWVEKEEGTMKIETTKDIFLKAPELIQLEAKQIVMKGETIQAHATDTIECIAEETLHLQSNDKVAMIGNSIAQESDTDLTQKANDIAIEVGSNMSTNVGSRFEVKAGDARINQ